MQSTFTLATTTFATPVRAGDNFINLASTTGIIPGIFLFANREVMKVEFLTGIGNNAKVLRGLEGTETRAHSMADTIYIAPGYQLFETDPTGLPPAATFVNPHINVKNGIVWVVQGDDVGGGTANRTWQQVTSTQTIGSLGVRVDTVTTPT